jgi:hypothetical protein
MRITFALLALASPLVAQPVVHPGDHVRLSRPSLEEGFRLPMGIVQAPGTDSALVAFTVRCDTTQRTVPYSNLQIRVAGPRQTFSYAVSGAMGAWLLSKTLGHVVAHNGGGDDAARAARYGTALLIPFTAIKGYQTRATRWVPLTRQTRRTEHLHVAREDRYLSRLCAPREGAALGDEPEDVGKHP